MEDDNDGVMMRIMIAVRMRMIMVVVVREETPIMELLWVKLG